MDEADEPTPLTSTRPRSRSCSACSTPPRSPGGARTSSTPWRGCTRVAAASATAMLDMVRLRLRQWAGVATGPDDWAGAFAAPIAPLWPLCGAEPPAWAAQPAPPRRRRAVARDLVASVARFNRRWAAFLDGLNLEPVNRQIDQYNRYYVLEKECVLGSARLAVRHFTPRARLTRGDAGRRISRVARPRAVVLKPRRSGVGHVPDAKEPAACLDRSSPTDPWPRPCSCRSRPSAPGRPRPSGGAAGVRGDVPARAPPRPDLGAGLRDARPGRGATAEPRKGPELVPAAAVLRRRGRDWKPGEPLRIGADAVGFPGPLDDAEAGRVRGPGGRPAQPRHAQARRRRGERLRARSCTLELDPEASGTVALASTASSPPRPFPETDRVKLVEIASPLLSAFHDRPIRHRAAVILPEGDPDADAAGRSTSSPASAAITGWRRRCVKGRRYAFGKDLIRVVLDPDCGTGHHVFADSATNGPRGRALVEELIPHIEETFPAIPGPSARLLNGHSSGGWSSLWLQVTYPDTFGGTWSTSPDPVDFRDFQRIDLYAPGENMFRDRDGKRRPIARRGDAAGPVLRRLLADGGRDRRRRPAPLVRGRLQPARPRRPPPAALGPRRPARSTPRSPAPGRRTTSASSWSGTGRRSARSSPASSTSSPATSTRSTSKVRSRLLKASLAALGSDAVVEIVPGKRPQHDPRRRARRAVRPRDEGGPGTRDARASDATPSPSQHPHTGR